MAINMTFSFTGAGGYVPEGRGSDGDLAIKALVKVREGKDLKCYLFLFYVYVYRCLFAYMSMYHVHEMPDEARRGRQIHCN